MKTKSTVLNREQIADKTEHIAYEIMETTFETPVIYIGGIAGNGYLFAERLVKKLSEISTQDIRLFQISVNKDNPLNEKISLSVPENELQDATVILVDDVINSGRTLIHAVKRILDHPVRVLKVAALVNRTHRRFPVHADFVGLNIATTLKDTIMVSFGDDEMAYLQ
ncbi:MAG: phosphoribosyltransferase [Crocinitomicaceae bacterium]|nr:phosphoribosyltransferase [Crocinitomicaceae bacterium]